MRRDADAVAINTVTADAPDVLYGSRHPPREAPAASPCRRRFVDSRVQQPGSDDECTVVDRSPDCGRRTLWRGLELHIEGYGTIVPADTKVVWRGHSTPDEHEVVATRARRIVDLKEC